MATQALLTIEQFLELDIPERRHAELDEGRLVDVTFPDFQHNRVCGRVFRLLYDYAQKRALGEAFTSDAPFRLGPDTLRGPDAAFLSNESLRRLTARAKYFEGGPDLVVEVVSPSDTARDMQRKVKQYLQAGAKLVWVIYPDLVEVQLFDADGSVRLLKDGDILEAPGILPGFRVTVNSLLAE
jgi:Uma2 family endonuclease